MVNRENSLQGRAHGPRRARRRRARLFPLALSLALAVVAAGCGLQTEQANSYISQASKNQVEEGIKITVELIQQVREIPGIKGVHIQAIEWEHKIPEILKKAGLLPRPVITKEEKEYAIKR